MNLTEDTCKECGFFVWEGDTECVHCSEPLDTTKAVQYTQIKEYTDSDHQRSANNTLQTVHQA